MNNEQLSPSDDQWQAIINNKHQADGNFWYGVTTTKIFCKPSCPSRLPKRDHVVIFDDPHEALQNGFRPCKRCRPLDRIVSNQVWIAEINHVLQTRFVEKLSLTELANLVHGDSSYLRHTYKKITGSTPQQRLTEIRLENARKLLESKMYSVSQVGIKVGIPNIAYFISLFKKQYGQTPLQYRNRFNLDNN
ncbi:MAG: AraC family transcriptional regulator [Lactobacillus sp.]|uniref:bifunctional transcriptional activator/DNA repair enzyme AdaA n=1 Tax=Limosilactobacillus coleohominis TaxID=181675 RepID=UPI002A91124C|nr:Ada metal-binding domain-containing protein [Limosilactobacillus coleohominis]MCI5812905.1 AraC family transcriptional regulator [Lactobacillus sp.]MDY5628557.1 Ada metal-binding domain-containing protein [Limosilactobacillus coleohominis]